MGSETGELLPSARVAGEGGVAVVLSGAAGFDWLALKLDCA
jgi:hypothetical protein